MIHCDFWSKDPASKRTLSTWMVWPSLTQTVLPSEAPDPVFACAAASASSHPLPCSGLLSSCTFSLDVSFSGKVPSSPSPLLFSYLMPGCIFPPWCLLQLLIFFRDWLAESGRERVWEEPQREREGLQQTARRVRSLTWASVSQPWDLHLSWNQESNSEPTKPPMPLAVDNFFNAYLINAFQRVGAMVCSPVTGISKVLAHSKHWVNIGWMNQWATCSDLY